MGTSVETWGGWERVVCARTRFATEHVRRDGDAERSRNVVQLPMYIAAVFSLCAAHQKVPHPAARMPPSRVRGA